MSKVQLKTIPTSLSVSEYINNIEDLNRRQDVIEILNIMKSVTKDEPVMWGTAIIGFGKVHYKYASGHEGDMPILGISNRKNAITLYGLVYYDLMEKNILLLENLGKYKRGKGCLYIKSISEINIDVLKQMIKNSFAGSQSNG